MDQARRAIDALQRAGIEAQLIGLGGPVRVEVFTPDPDVAARAAEVLERADGVRKVERTET